MSKTWCFSAVDSWFFKESRPMEAVGSSELASVFPPSSRTLLGAVRSSIGESRNVNWHEYHEQKSAHPLASHIGYGDDLGAIGVRGPWVHQGQERLYPAPLNLMTKEASLHFLQIGAACHCDLGKAVCLPKLPDTVKGAKSLENCWLTRDSYEAVLAGETPKAIIQSHELFDSESRIGIARDNETRIVKDGLLYQTQHVRPKSDVFVSLDIAGLEQDLEQPEGQSELLLRLGGEGRMASVKIQDLPKMPITAKSSPQTHGIIIYLLTPLACADNQPMPFAGFEQQELTEQTVWKGPLQDINISVHSAVQGKVQREGGWNMAAHKPRAVESYWPAGSCWYCTVDDGDIDAAIQQLHLSQIGTEADQKMGRGLIAVGLWQKELVENKQ